MRNSIVIGLGFGDEGKGLITDYLSLQNPGSIVVRFNGGHQAGHTVVTSDGKRHVFSSFGSGTLRGNPTYWSKYCTVDPVAFLNERAALLKLGVVPKMYMDALAMITTPYDVAFNKDLAKNTGHGSVGVGFGTTIERNQGPHKLYVQDLVNKFVMRIKIESIRQYYQKMGLMGVQTGDFTGAINEFLNSIEIVLEREFFNNRWRWYNYTFEGAQGIMLDMDFGFHPYTTWSNTTSRNAMQIIKDNGLNAPTVYYVTRAYQTRHGNGPMTTEHKPVDLRNNFNETNKMHDYQGNFRTGQLDVDLLKYAVSCDNNYSYGTKKVLCVTCLDQVENFNINLNNICPEASIIKSFSPCAEFIGLAFCTT